ncbi:MAG: CHC2 zinc finger domain-containing protein [Eubacteriales bacterium]|nr:CHC2 zinc finger domain-containing protein [Eubacteriales bacterium]
MLKDDEIMLVRESVSMKRLAEYYGFKVNRNGFMRCPFHQEKTASMKVYDGTKGYYCFGCGAGGSIFNFVMDYENLGFEEAVRYIAGAFSLSITDGETELSTEDKRKIAEQRKQREKEHRQAEANRQSMIGLTEKIRLYQTLMQGVRPFGGLFCYLANRLPMLIGEWEHRFEAMKK